MITESAGKLVEIQIRTSLQHLWAEMSERMADRYGAAIKYGGGDRLERGLLVDTSELVAEHESSQPGHPENIGPREQIARLFRDMIAALEKESS